MPDLETVIASAAKQSIARTQRPWIASSRSLSSGARSRVPLAPRTDDKYRLAYWQSLPGNHDAKETQPARSHQGLGSARADRLRRTAEGCGTRAGGDHARADRGRAQRGKSDSLFVDGSSSRREARQG